MGHTVLDFSDPLEAVRALSENPFDLVICDVQMPGMDGFQVARKVVEGFGTTPPKVLLISGYDAGGRLDEFPPSAVIGLLPKPFSVAEFAEVLDVVENTREKCPGRIAVLCERVQKHRCGEGDDARLSLCHSPQYSECEHYDAMCGERFRSWVSAGGGKRETPSA